MGKTMYRTSDGEEVMIGDMNNFHLVNAMLKTQERLVLNENPENVEEKKFLLNALKQEVLGRMKP